MLFDVMIRPITTAALIGLSAYGILAQSTPTSSASNVATIKPSGPYARGVSFRSVNHHFVVDNHTLRECIGYAYNLAPELVSGGPEWIGSDRYDMVAELPAVGGAAPMFQALLADRFKLLIHREPKLSPVYNLVVGSNELKIKESAGPGSLSSGAVTISPPPRVGMLPARNMTMAQFAALMQRMVVNKPVLDKTGLSGRYNFDLEWTPGETRATLPSAPASDSKPDIFTAIQQLGLALVPAQDWLDMIVVDYVEKPSEN
jgi:uncharacterized protein (TIGR03435 family)